MEVLSHLNPSCASRARTQHRPNSLPLLGNARKRDEKGMYILSLVERKRSGKEEPGGKGWGCREDVV